MSYDKTEMNAFVQHLYDQKMQEGKHGHYETMFHAVHKAIERAALQSAQPVAQPLTREQVITACYSFRHDFGLLPQDVKDSLIRSATDWAKAFGIGGKL